MPRIAPVNLTDLPPEAQAAVDEHLRQGYRLTNEKLTLLHNVTAFEALEAQSYAVGFYEREGFRTCSEEFLEDGIPHVQVKLER